MTVVEANVVRCHGWIVVISHAVAVIAFLGKILGIRCLSPPWSIKRHSRGSHINVCRNDKSQAPEIVNSCMLPMQGVKMALT